MTTTGKSQQSNSQQGKGLPGSGQLFHNETGTFDQTTVRKTAPPTRHKQVILGNPPAKSNCYRIIILRNKDKTKQHASLAKSEDLKAYEKSFAFQCAVYRHAHINVPFEIELDCFYTTMRSDLDNTLKAVLDCLQEVEAISNDNLCARITMDKHVDKENPRVEFTLHAKEPLQEWVPKKPKKAKAPKAKKVIAPKVVEPQIPII